MAPPGLEDIVDSVCPLSSNRAKVSVGEVCKILVLNRLNSPSLGRYAFMNTTSMCARGTDTRCAMTPRGFRPW